MVNSIDMIYEEKIRLHVEGNIERALNIPDAINGLDPRNKIVYGKIQDGEYRELIVDMIVKHIMRNCMIYDKENLDYNTRVQHYMNQVYLTYNEVQIAKLAVACDAALTETLNNHEKRGR